MLTHQDDPLIAEFETLTAGGLKYRKKRMLKAKIGKPFALGNNSIEVMQVSNKYVKISEVFNGLNQEHKRYTIGTALEYITYREKQFMCWPTNDTQIDVSTQTKQYQQQYDNVEESRIDISNYITICWKSAFTKGQEEWQSKIEFDEKSITILFETGFVYAIKYDERGTDRYTRFQLTHNLESYSDKLSQSYWLAQRILQNFATLMYRNEDMMYLVESQVNCNAQLKKLYTEPIESVDPRLLADLHHFIQSASNDTYTYGLSSVCGLERRMDVIRVSDKRTAVKIIASIDGKEFCEYRKDINKIQHHIEYNATIIGKIAENHNY